MKRPALLLLLFLSLGLNVGIGVALLGHLEDEEAPPELRERRLPPGVYRLADEIGLEGERRERFLDAQERFLGRTLGAHDRLRRAQSALSSALAEPDVERPAVDPLLADLDEAHRSLEESFVDSYFEIRSLLTPPEARRFVELVVERRAERRGGLHRWRERWQQRGGPPDPFGRLDPSEHPLRERRDAFRERLRQRLEEGRDAAPEDEAAQGAESPSPPPPGEPKK